MTKIEKFLEEKAAELTNEAREKGFLRRGQRVRVAIENAGPLLRVGTQLTAARLRRLVATPLDLLEGIDARYRNALSWRHEIMNLGQLAVCDESFLGSIPRIGRKGIGQIVAALARLRIPVYGPDGIAAILKTEEHRLSFRRLTERDWSRIFSCFEWGDRHRAYLSEVGKGGIRHIFWEVRGHAALMNAVFIGKGTPYRIVETRGEPSARIAVVE